MCGAGWRALADARAGKVDVNVDVEWNLAGSDYGLSMSDIEILRQSTVILGLEECP
jgi:hypothetical protein